MPHLPAPRMRCLCPRGGIARVNTEPEAMLDALYASALDVGAQRNQIYGYGRCNSNNGVWPRFLTHIGGQFW